MKMYLMFILIIVFTATSRVTGQQKMSIAVLDMDHKGITENEATVISERLRSELVRTEAFTVLERDKMNEILTEQGFQQSGCTSTECVVEAGRLANVQLIVAGHVGKIGNLFTINIRLIDVETGKLLKSAVEDCECPIETVLTQSVPNVAHQLAGKEPVSRGEKKHPRNAFLYSLVLPGTGQIYTNCSKKRIAWFIGGGITAWMVTAVGYSQYLSAKDNADYLYSVDPSGTDRNFTILDETEDLEKTGSEWREEERLNRTMTYVMGAVSCAIHVFAAVDASNQAKNYNRRHNITMYYNPYSQRYQLTLSYRF